MSGGLQSNNDSENEQKSEADWSSPPVFDSEKDVSQANGPRNNTKDPGSKSNGESSSSEVEISSYFQKPPPAVQMAERKDGPEQKTQSTSQQHASDQKCFTCAKEGYKCVGSYPFTEMCDSCRSQQRECYPQDEGQRKPQPAEEKCHPCRQKRRLCDGTYPFAQTCSSCQKYSRTCTAEGPEKPEKGLPKHQKCHRCAKDQRNCVGEPPFQDRCAACKARGRNCYPQDVEVPEAAPDEKGVPHEERCMGCKKGRKCDGQRPCTACTTRNQACSYEDGNVRWTYQTDPKKWMTPTSPACQNCLRYNTTHFGSNLPCDGDFPCDSCVEEQIKTTARSSSCIYHLENGVSKYWRLEGEHAQELRKQKIKWGGDRRKRQKMMGSEIKDQNAQDGSIDEDDNDAGSKDNSESDSDRESNPDNYPDPANQLHPDDDDWDAGGDSSNKHPNQHHEHDHESDQGEAADSPDDQDE